MKILSLFKNDTKRLLKDVGVLLSLLLMPLMFLIPTILNSDFSDLERTDESREKGTPLVVADYDGGDISLDYIKELGENLQVEQNFSGDVLAEYDLQNDPRCAQPGPECDQAVGLARLMDGSLSGVLIIPKGLTASFKDGKQTPVTLLFDPGGDAMLATQLEKVSQGLAIKVALTKQVEGAKGDFSDLNSVSDPKIRAEVDKLINQPTIGVGTGNKTAIHVDEVNPAGYEEKTLPGAVEQGLPQMSVLFIFLFPMFLVSWIREEQSNGLFRRLLSTPASRTEMITGKLIFGVLVCTIQIAVIFVLGIIASNSKGHAVQLDIPGFLVLTLALSATSTSLGLLIASTQLPATIALAPMLLGGALGGAMIFIDYMPAFMQSISYLTPQRYGIDGFLDLLARGGTLVSVLPEAGVLFLFTLLFAGIAIWRFDLLD